MSQRTSRSSGALFCFAAILCGAACIGAAPAPHHRSKQTAKKQAAAARAKAAAHAKSVAHARASSAARPAHVVLRRPAPLAHRPPVRMVPVAAPENTDLGLADERQRANQGAIPLSLKDALGIALENNPQRVQAMAAARAAIANIRTARSAGGLQVGLDGSATRSRNASTATNTAAPGTANIQSIELGADLPLYTGGRVKASTRVAIFNAQAQIAQEKQVEQDLILNTTLAYLNILRAEELLDVAGSNLAVSRERLRVATVRYSVGASARLDVLQARTDLADARQRRIEASNAVGQADANLNTLLGRAPATPLRVEMVTALRLPPLLSTAVTAASSAGAPVIPSTTSSPLAPQPLSSAPGPTATTPNVPAPGGAPSSAGGTTGTGSAAAGGMGSTATTGGITTTTGAGAGTSATTATTSGSLGATTSVGGTAAIGSATTGTAATGVTTSAAGSQSSLTTTAGASRQSLAVIAAQLQAAQASLDLARAQRRPSLGLSLTALLRNPATFLGYFGSEIGLALGQTLFDSGRISSQVEEARAVVDQSREQLAGARLDVANAIEADLLALDSAQRRLADADTGVVSAREALRIAQLGFRNGVRTTLDISSAQAAQLAAGTDAVNARFDVATAQAQIAATIGIVTLEAQDAYQRAQREDQQHLVVADKKKHHKFLGIF